MDAELVAALGGPPAEWARDGGEPGPDYWLRVWAARGLLYAWHGSARPAIVSALTDDAWRVREMTLRVVAERGIKVKRLRIQEMLEDPSARVRAAAARTMERLESERGRREDGG